MPTMDELLDAIRQAADQVGEHDFLELLRWHRVIALLPEADWTARGAYRQAVAELDEARAVELLRDLRRAARDPRRHRHGADGKPRYQAGQTLAQRRRTH